MPRRFAACTALALSLSAVLLVPACGGQSAPEPPPVVTPSPTEHPPDPGPVKITVQNAKDVKLRPFVTVNRGQLPTKLETTDLVPGSGRAVGAQDSVTVQYVGVIARNGQEFKASWDDGQPAVFTLPTTIAGFRNGLVGMQEGGRRQIVMPPDQAYGAAGNGSLVGPDETLIYIVDLVKIN
jgi:peptidylprolyl isomerase